MDQVAADCLEHHGSEHRDTLKYQGLAAQLAGMMQ